MTVTEMVSAKGLVYNPEKSGELLRTCPEEKIKSVQLFGHEPEFFERALESKLLDAFDVIDINMGCPVPKIVKNGDGSALMNNVDTAYAIVRACVKKASGRPVTVKTRLGFYEGENTAFELCRAAESAGAAAVTVHGRTRAMGYSGTTDINAVREVKRGLTIPVIASGDVSENNAEEFIDGVDGLMIGRGAIGRPQIFAKILGREWRLSLKETIFEHIDVMRSVYGERYAYVNMRKHMSYYLNGVPGKKELKQKLFSIVGTDELKREIDELISE